MKSNRALQKEDGSLWGSYEGGTAKVLVNKAKVSVKGKVRGVKNNKEFDEGTTCRVEGTWQIMRILDWVTGLECELWLCVRGVSMQRWIWTKGNLNTAWFKPSTWCASKKPFKCVVMDIPPLLLQMLFMFMSFRTSNSLVNPPLSRSCLSQSARSASF